jgi:hypothetical protein
MYSSAFALNCTQNQNDLDVYEQTQRLNCEVRGIADNINTGRNTVPRYIYHFGPKKYLEEDIEARTIPPKAWDNFIVGKKTRYHLAPYRRGLYGTGGIDRNSYGGDLGKEEPWLMQIEVKEECRKPESVVTFLNLPESKRFQTWFSSLPHGATDFKNPDEFVQICKTDSMDSTGILEDARCGQFIDQYLKDTDVKVIHDHLIDKSFYLRDRNCIQTIRGTPAELIEMAAKNDLLWLRPCRSVNAGAKAFVRILGKALAEYANEVPLDIINKLISHAKLAGVEAAPFEAYRRCLDTKNMETYRKSAGSATYQSACRR